VNDVSVRPTTGYIAATGHDRQVSQPCDCEWFPPVVREAV